MVTLPLSTMFRLGLETQNKCVMWQILQPKLMCHKQSRNDGSQLAWCGVRCDVFCGRDVLYVFLLRCGVVCGTLCVFVFMFVFLFGLGHGLVQICALGISFSASSNR